MQDGARVSALPVVLYTDCELNLYCIRVDDKPAQAFRDPARVFWYLESMQRFMYPRIKADGGALPLLCVFVNNLKVFAQAIYQRYPDAEEAGKKRQGLQETQLQITTPFCIFRSFDAIANSTPAQVSKMFRTENRLEAMGLLLDELAAGAPWCKVRWSLAYQSKKAFYKGIRSELWEQAKQHGTLFKSIEHYNDMFAGNKGGLLMLYESEEHRKKLRQVFHGVESWDKRSAYPGIIVSDDMFPIGAPVKIVREKVDCLKMRIQFHEWFKIVIESRGRIPELDLFEGVPEHGVRRYGIEWYDWRVLTECLDVPQARIEAILNGHNWKLYISPSTGFLPDCLRFKIVENYLEKELYDKTSPRRFFIKTQIDMIIGKGLQYRGFKTAKEVNAHYIGRGENYIQPQHSMHCIAAVRYELMTLIKELGADAISWDTDGIKAKSGRIGEILRQRNENIEALNYMSLGYKNGCSVKHCNIGTWDYEGTGDYMPLAPKSYLFKPEGGPLVFKHCGISDDDIARYIAGRGDLFEHFKRPREIKTKGGYTYYTRIRKYSREETLFTL